MTAEQAHSDATQQPGWRRQIEHDPIPAAGTQLEPIGLVRAHPPQRNLESRGALDDRRQTSSAGAGHRQVASLDDSRLLDTDQCQRATQVPLMVVLDVGDRRDPQVEHVRGVEPAAHPDLHDRQVHR